MTAIKHYFDELPREKLSKKGDQALSNTELLALLLTTGGKYQHVIGLAHEMLKAFGSLEKLFKASLQELMQFKGIGLAKASILRAAFTLAERKELWEKERVRLGTPEEIFAFMAPIMRRYAQEVLFVLSKDVKGYLIAHDLVSMGSINELIAHPREIFYPAIRCKAFSIVIVHNHLSGDPTPSFQDIELTKALVIGANFLGIPLDQHIVMGGTTFATLPLA